ncbi:hypothetical protein [Streptomyces alanosinicus]|uniref:hypothetical protein n=1 Tax=Streptomyces alanosinicus TaxID=68171 RepID=UPI001676A305|nr:hypothetical protein [Streptomyces alanosinicus]
MRNAASCRMNHSRLGTVRTGDAREAEEKRMRERIASLAAVKRLGDSPGHHYFTVAK